jgi:cytochrome c oxidase assembly factor CtaG
MNWWCSATNTPWSWEWRAYPGVWLIVILLGVLYFRSRSRALTTHPRLVWGGGRVATFLLGLLLVWASLDWPIGTLGGGYLASMHSVQWLMLSQIAPPFLILGVPPDAWRLLGATPRWKGVLHRAAGGIFGLVVFNVVLLVTHVPGVTDLLMASQLGSFTIDAAWFLSGLALWWPVLAPPGIARINEPLKIGYLFAATIVPTVPAAMLTFSALPVYQLYELAPRVGSIQAHSDQQMAGLLMKAVADPIMWVSMAIIFFRWSAMEKRTDDIEAAAR